MVREGRALIAPVPAPADRVSFAGAGFDHAGPIAEGIALSREWQRARATERESMLVKVSAASGCSCCQALRFVARASAKT
jgi:hypothetical protein